MTTDESSTEPRSSAAASVYPAEVVPTENLNSSMPPNSQVKPEEDAPMQVSTAPLPSLQESYQNGGVATGFEAPASVPMPRFSVSSKTTY